MKNLKIARKNMGLTQKNVADKLGIPVTTYANYEQRENSKPPIKILLQLSDLFNCSTDFLLGNTKYELKKTNIPSSDDNTIRIIARGGGIKEFKVTDEQRKAIETLLGKDYIDPDVKI